MTFKEYIDALISTSNIPIGIVKKLFILDKDGKRVDFSDKFEINGTNRLIDFEVVETVVEKGFNHFYNRTGDISVRNNDRFFNLPLSSTLKDIYGSSTSFLQDKGNIINVFKKPGIVTGSQVNSRYTYVELFVELEIFKKIYFAKLATFVLSKILTDLSGKAIIKTDGLVEIAANTPAYTIVDGLNNWYRQRPLSFLIREVLKKAYGVYIDISTSPFYKQTILPAGFIIPKFKELIVTFDESVNSALGRPPVQTDEDNDGEPDTFPSTSKLCRALEYDSIRNCVYLGIDNELWKFDLDTWIFKKWMTLDEDYIIEHLQLINKSGHYYLFIKSRVLNIHEILVTNTKTDSDLKAKQINLSFKDLGDGTSEIVEAITSMVTNTEFDTDFVYMSTYSILFHVPTNPNYWPLDFRYKPITLTTWVGNINKLSENLPIILNEAEFVVGWQDLIDIEKLSTTLTGIESTVYSSSTFNYNLINFKTLNIPIPFSQTLYYSSIGSIYPTDNTLGRIATNNFLIAFFKSNKFKDACFDEKEKVNTEIKTDNISTFNLSAGYFGILAQEYYVKRENAYDVPAILPSDPTFFSPASNRYVAIKNIKFTLGQIGINEIIKDSSGSLYQIEISNKNIKIGRSIIEHSLDGSSANISDISWGINANDRIDTISYPSISLYFINPITNFRLLVWKVQALHYQGRAISPLCIIPDPENNIFYLFGITFETIDSIQYFNLSAIGQGKQVGATKSAKLIVLKFNIDANGFGNIILNASIYNNKTPGTGINGGYDQNTPNFRITDPSNIIDATNYLLRVKSLREPTPGTLDNEYSCLIISKGRQGNDTLLSYSDCFFRLATVKDLENIQNNLLPSGDFRTTTATKIAYNEMIYNDIAILDGIMYGSGSNRRLYVSVLILENIGTTNISVVHGTASILQYAIWQINPVDFANPILVKTFYNQPKNLKIAGTKLFFTLEDNGTISSFDLSANPNVSFIAQTYKAYDPAEPAVVDETTTHSNIVIVDSSNKPTAYAISAPSGRDRYNFRILPGKYYFWQLSTKYIPQIEFADFEGMNCEDVLNKFCEIINWIKGFDENGNFFMVNRLPEYTEPDITLLESIDTKYIDITDVDTTVDELVNKMAITPYRTVLQPIKAANVTYKKRADEKSYPNLNLDVEQRDLNKKTINLICVRDGEVSIDKEDITLCPLFKWRITDKETEVTVAITVPIGETTLYLSSVYGGEFADGGIKRGNLIKIQNVDTSEYEFRTIFSVSASNNSIEIDFGFSFAILKNTTGYITSTKNLYYSNERVAVCTVRPTTEDLYSFKVDSIDNIGIGNILESSLKGTKTIVKNKIRNDDKTFTVQVDIANFCVEGEIIKAYWAPLLSNTLYEVGGSSIFIKLSIKDDKDLLNSVLRTFYTADYIEIICDGLKLEPDETAKQTYIDIESASIYGIIEGTSPDNKFLSRPLARNLAKIIVKQNAIPRYTANIKSVFLPGLKVVKPKTNIEPGRLFVIRIQNANLFPLFLYNSIDFYVTSIKHTIGKRTTEFSIRAIEGIAERVKGQVDVSETGEITWSRADILFSREDVTF